MALLGAPSALRVPISRVRSVMDTSMIFMTPIPPTSSAMPAITAMAVVMVDSISDIISTMEAILKAMGWKSLLLR